MTDYTQQQQAQYQMPPSAYDGSHYGNQETHSGNQRQTFTAYHPGVYQQQHQQPYSPEQLQTYSNQTYHDQYKSYYASLKAAEQQQQQQEPPLQQLKGQTSWDPERPSLKPQRSFFSTGGVKNTLDKAKIMGTFLNRK
jgi:hypothetical protein